MEFTKAHGTANDFVVLADLQDAVELTPTLVRALCDRRRGVGADGVLRIGAPSGRAQVFMDYRNADGSIVEMCGNGVRVVAKHAVDHGLVVPDGDTLVVGTRAGNKPVSLERDDDGTVAAVTVDMGPPILDPTEVPFHAERPESVTEPFVVGDVTVELSALSMGNPHAVIVVDDVDETPVRTLGPEIELDERFPKRTNVEFAQVVDRGRIRLRVWERGVGETAACGTGACAAVVALQRRGLVGGSVEVALPGGLLRIRHRPDEDPSVFLTGPAVEVASGTLAGSWVAAATRGELEGEVLR